MPRQVDAGIWRRVEGILLLDFLAAFFGVCFLPFDFLEAALACLATSATPVLWSSFFAAAAAAAFVSIFFVLIYISGQYDSNCHPVWVVRRLSGCSIAETF